MTLTFILLLSVTTAAFARPAAPTLSPGSKRASSFAGCFFLLPHNCTCPTLSLLPLLPASRYQLLTSYSYSLPSNHSNSKYPLISHGALVQHRIVWRLLNSSLVDATHRATLILNTFGGLRDQGAV